MGSCYYSPQKVMSTRMVNNRSYSFNICFIHNNAINWGFTTMCDYTVSWADPLTVSLEQFPSLPARNSIIYCLIFVPLQTIPWRIGASTCLPTKTLTKYPGCPIFRYPLFPARRIAKDPDLSSCPQYCYLYIGHKSLTLSYLFLIYAKCVVLVLPSYALDVDVAWFKTTRVSSMLLYRTRSERLSCRWRQKAPRFSPLPVPRFSLSVPSISPPSEVQVSPLIERSKLSCLQ